MQPSYDTVPGYVFRMPSSVVAEPSFVVAVPTNYVAAGSPGQEICRRDQPSHRGAGRLSSNSQAITDNGPPRLRPAPVDWSPLAPTKVSLTALPVSGDNCAASSSAARQPCFIGQWSS